MPQISIIKKSDIDKAKRFDAEYFKPEYLEIENKLEQVKNDYLFNLADNTYKNYNPKNKENYFNYIEISKINLMTGEYIKEKISNSEQPSRAKKKCNKFDLLISTVRPNRSAISLILEEKVNLVASTGFCKLGKIKINPYYLFVLFKTKDYTKLLVRNTTATQYPTVNENDILSLKIPILPQTFQLQIESLVKQAHQKQHLAKENDKQAEKILLEELDLLHFEIKHQLWFTATKREVDRAKRFDAEYFQPKYKEIIKKIENYKGGFCEVGELVNWKKGFEVGSEQYLDKGLDFGRVSDFSINGFENTSKKISEDIFLKLKDNFQPKKGDILFTKDGTVGLAYLLKENFKGILSSAFLRLNLKKTFDKETLTLILNSVLSKLQVEKFSGGAIISHLKPSEFEKIKIPLISQPVQQKISKLIAESHSLRKDSKDLLEKAKIKIEKKIERF